MGLFDFFSSPVPGQLVDELVMLTFSPTFTTAERQILDSGALEAERYFVERTLFRAGYTASFAHYVSYKSNDIFFREVDEALAVRIEELVSNRGNLGFADIAAAKRHMESTYTMDMPDRLLTKLFHTLRDETLIRNSKVAHDAFFNAVSGYCSSVGAAFKPHLLRRKN